MTSRVSFGQAAQPLIHWLLGADKHTRARVVGVGLCTLVYSLCCMAAWQGAQIGVVRPWAVPVIGIVALPVNLLVLVLVRSGWSQRRADPSLMLPQNALALCTISFAYTTIGPDDRGLVFVLLTLVMVFGMYTHTPRQTLIIGGGAIALLGGIMVVLTQVDPAFYPPQSELIRFELLLGCMPVLAYTAHKLAKWRDRLKVQRAELTQALATVQHLATRDALTGLVNRRHMQERLDEAVQRLNRHGERFTVALIDLDHFKQINDRHGHRVGDEALAAFSQAAASVLRDSDTLARWGGEEFLILFPDTQPEQACIPLLRLQSLLVSRAVSDWLPALLLSFSSGLYLHVASATLDHTLERADAALYEAKRSGRNRVELAPRLVVEAEPGCTQREQVQRALDAH
jgi:diguanylate cyclase